MTFLPHFTMHKKTSKRKQTTSKNTAPKNKTNETAAGFNPSVVGILDVNKQGMGYVEVSGMTQDIKISADNLGNAMQGDKVAVNIFKFGKTTKRPEGKIVQVLKRGFTELVGTVQLNENFAFVLPDQSNFKADIYVGKLTEDIKNNDRVLVKIIEWDKSKKNPTGEIIKKINAEDEDNLAMENLLKEAGFSLSFSKEAMKIADKMSAEITDEELELRRDMRNIHTFTIDPFDAKDFDDAISYRVLKNGNTEIGIHIADVSHFLKEGSILDKEALERATSVYLPDRVNPMLPEKISNGLCSLRPNEDKYTFSVVVQFDDKKEIKNYWMGKTITHSVHRYTYEDVQEILDGGKGVFENEIKATNEISKHLRAKRMTNGAINFSSEEVRFLLDEKGIPTGIVVKKSEASHQLIEELMLLANKTVAEYIHKQKINKQAIPFPYRIHDAPDMEKLMTYAMFASKFGFKFDLSSPQTITSSFNEMIAKTKDKPELQVLHSLGIRTMSKAVYTTENIGHYGLAFPYYCHFTSPIRRYPDVIAHRVLQNLLMKQPLGFLKKNGAEETCKHCSDQERKAMEAERSGNKYKQVQYMQQFIGEEFDAIINGVSQHGFWCQTIAHYCEGFVSIYQMENRSDYYFDEENFSIINKVTKAKLQIGQTIKIKVVAANLFKRQLDFDLVK